ncbi:iron-containing alcohol dehydrogenase [Paenibacillus alkalitolerans]|uniref:iron-containing alcohol dehydrogenase n=1 Tax=Paenibacillus alkalitolerans TaxID=2799335 RepID=UPI0018F448A9|nr:iron-containing alcohol dehydrogenase [Paenibacillus alkalitolerans]
MAMNAFQFAGTPAIYFGVGTALKLVDALPQGTRRVLFVMGGFQRTNAEYWEMITASLAGKNIAFDTVHIHHEPTVEWVDDVTDRYRPQPFDAVVAIGGGSAMDAGKAVAAMLLTEPGDTILNYLEGQPAYRPHNGNKVFFVAIPTTSGTGSETTKNAVISIPGGFKRSIRHDRFIPDVAIVDGQLTLSCPPSVKAASGLDALTQLIESYVSTKASPLTDALALSGIEAAARSLLPICTHAADNAALHEQIAYASMLSGITLANAGLGLVHGFAGPLGGSFPIPHGVICGTLLAEVTKRNIEQLAKETSDTAAEALAKYAKVGAILTGRDDRDVRASCERLAAVLEEWTELLEIPVLGWFGVDANNIDAVIAAADNKQSPVQLGSAIMREILLARL